MHIKTYVSFSNQYTYIYRKFSSPHKICPFFIFTPPENFLNVAIKTFICPKNHQIHPNVSSKKALLRLHCHTFNFPFRFSVIFHKNNKSYNKMVVSSKLTMISSCIQMFQNGKTKWYKREQLLHITKLYCFFVFKAASS